MKNVFVDAQIVFFFPDFMWLVPTFSHSHQLCAECGTPLKHPRSGDVTSHKRKGHIAEWSVSAEWSLTGTGNHGNWPGVAFCCGVTSEWSAATLLSSRAVEETPSGGSTLKLHLQIHFCPYSLTGNRESDCPAIDWAWLALYSTI